MLSETDFDLVAHELKTRAGAALSRETKAIVAARLAPLARREGFAAVAELVQAARLRGDALWSAIADALLPSETRFFRERETFARLKSEIIPALARVRPGGRLRIWCAGVGGGQEAYSLALLIDALRAEGGAGAEIVATDISERALEKARTGLYTQFEVQRGLPIRTLIAHFEKAGDLWRISDRLRAAVRFEQHNLLHNAARLGAFDIVLCCNVMTSFDTPTRAETIQRLSDVLAADGVLILGPGEPLPEDAGGFTGADGIYTRTPARRAA